MYGFPRKISVTCEHWRGDAEIEKGTLASDYTVVSYGLAGILADISPCIRCDGSAAGPWAAAGLLDRILTLAVEIPVRGGCRTSDCAAADGSWVLCVDRVGCAQPARSMVAVADRTHSGVHF